MKKSGFNKHQDAKFSMNKIIPIIGKEKYF